MPKTDKNIKDTENFIRRVLKDKFGQSVEGDALAKAARKLCDAIPEQKKQAA